MSYIVLRMENSLLEMDEKPRDDLSALTRSVTKIKFPLLDEAR